MKSRPEKHLKTLGLEPGAGPEAIRSAYRNLAKRYHPDAGGEDQSPEKFRKVREAYEHLSGCQVASPESEISVHHQAAPASIFREVFFRPLSFFASSFFGSPFGNELELEIVLSPAEAARGVILQFELPLETACPDCSQVGIRGFARCSRCAGLGKVTQTRTYTLELPENIPDGSLLELTHPELSSSISVIILIQ